VRTVFLAPRRDDGGHRDALWRYARARWEKILPDVPIYEGHDDGPRPFNRAKAINLASAAAGKWDFGIIIDSDVMYSQSQARAAIALAQDTGKVTWGHRRWRGIAQEETARIIADNHDFGPEIDPAEIDLLAERTNPISWSCFIVVPRPVFDDLGGLDERFEGWGFEDMAFQSIVVGLYGHERTEGDVIHLWHPRSSDRLTNGRQSATKEYTLNARLGRRYMVALRRDHGLHDRPGLPASEAENIRDVENLKRDDQSLMPLVRKYGLPDWQHWWPTLEELKQSAKEQRFGPPPAVTVVMRSGGTADVWPERKEYLRRSLASFNEHVTGPMTQKVVYSDWDHEFHAELHEIASAAGFYVVGLRQHSGYIAAMQALWGYLERHCVGDYVFSIEDDFTYSRDVDLVPMMALLDADPNVLQVALLRGPYYPKEQEAGSVLASIDGWREQRDGYIAQRDHFTANPSLFRRDLIKNRWPSGKSSERIFGDRLLANQRSVFAYWGDGAPWIEHIGAVRAGTAY
jgi:hypothetical protein